MQNYQNVARYIELFFVKILLLKPGSVKVCLRKSIVANKNQRGARYVNCTKKYHCVSTGFGEVK